MRCAHVQLSHLPAVTSISAALRHKPVTPVSNSSDFSMEERTLNFLDNWIDANITSASHEPDGDASTMQYRFLTDAVAAGLALDDVNAEWREAEIKIRKALEARRFKR